MESDEEAGSGGSTPVQDEHHYNSDGEEPMSVDQPTSPSRGTRGGKKCDARDIDRNDGDVKEVLSDAEDSDNEREKGNQSDDDRLAASPVSGPQSPDANSQDGPRSPISETGSPQGPQSPDQDSQDREGGPQSPGQESRSGPQSPDQQVRSCSASSEQRSRSVSRSPSNRSRSRSPSNRSRSLSQRSRSGSPQRSRSGSPQKSRTGSPVQRSRSRSGSADQRSSSRSGSPGQRSRSGSPQRSRSGSPQRSGSPGQRSRSGSPAQRSRSASGSPSRKSRSGSPQMSRSRSGSPGERSGSGSDDRRSRSGSRSPSPRSKAGSKSPESLTAEDGERKKKSGRDSPHSDEDSDVGQPAEESAPAKVEDSDDEDESDKESAVGGLIADIFGSSDEDEEFEGFGVADVEAPVKKKEKKKTAVVSDDDEEEDEGIPEGGDTQEQEQGAEAGVVPTQGAEGEGDAPQAGSDDDMIKEDFVSDFEVMMHKKKEESQKYKRKRRDVDIINDNDDLIADMINKMKTAAEEDRAANENKKAATKKIKYLPAVRSQLKKADLHVAFLDCGILSAITEWLAPLPDRSLPHIQIRETMLKFLGEFPPVGADTLKASGIGKAVMYIYKHPKETRENKERAGKLINEWSRPIFNLTSNFKSLSREERQQRDYDQLPKRRRLSSDGSQTPRRDIDKALAGEDKALRPGDPGWIYRARVPNPSHKDYVVRPRWNVEEMALKGASKKQVTRYEKHIRAFQEKKKGSKNQRAVTISIEGRNMSL